MKTLTAIACLLALPAWADTGETDGAAVQQAFAEVVRKVAPAVVCLDIDIEAREKPRSREQRLQDRLTPALLREYYARPEGPVSGVIVGSDGYIVTTYFAVEGEVRGIEVHLADGRTLEGELLGRDQVLDLAIIKVDATDLPTVEPADVSKLRVGQFLIVVGRSPDPARPTVTSGILSADGRNEGTALQTDAEIDYGNLGGAVVDLDGRLVGVAAQLSVAEYGLNSGVAFATRWDCVEQALPDLKAGKVVTRPPRPFLGVQAAEGNLDVEGALVAEVVRNSAAEKAGLRKRDLIVEFQGQKIKEWDDLASAIRGCQVGDEVKMLVRRDDVEIEIEAVLGEKR